MLHSWVLNVCIYLLYVCIYWFSFLFFYLFFPLSPVFSPAYEMLYQMLLSKKEEHTYLEVCQFLEITKQHT